jgi:hypothetical protein
MRKIKLIITSLILVSPFAANAQDTITVTISGFGTADGQWEVSLLGPTTYAASSTELESQIWWDNLPLALEFSNLVNSGLGTPNVIGPNYAIGPVFQFFSMDQTYHQQTVCFGTAVQRSGSARPMRQMS